MRIIRLFSVFLLGITLSCSNACTSDADASKKRYEKISTAYCECTAQLAELNRQAQKADPSQLNDYFQKMQTEYTRAKECTATIIGHYGHLNAAELDSVNIFLKTRCPDLADKPEQLQEFLGE